MTKPFLHLPPLCASQWLSEALQVLPPCKFSRTTTPSSETRRGGSIICSHKHVTGVIFTLQVIYICKESDYQWRQVKGIMMHLGDTLHSVFASRSRSLKFCGVIKKSAKRAGQLFLVLLCLIRPISCYVSDWSVHSDPTWIIINSDTTPWGCCHFVLLMGQMYGGSWNYSTV